MIISSVRKNRAVDIVLPDAVEPYNIKESHYEGVQEGRGDIRD